MNSVLHFLGSRRLNGSATRSDSKISPKAQNVLVAIPCGSASGGGDESTLSLYR